MAFTEDFDLFLDTDDFGVKATFGSNTINVIMDKEYIENENIIGFAPVATCKTSDVETLDIEDSIVIESVTYYVVHKEQDGVGMTRVILHT